MTKIFYKTYLCFSTNFTMREITQSSFVLFIQTEFYLAFWHILLQCKKLNCFLHWRTACYLLLQVDLNGNTNTWDTICHRRYPLVSNVYLLEIYTHNECKLIFSVQWLSGQKRINSVFTHDVNFALARSLLFFMKNNFILSASQKHNSSESSDSCIEVKK